MRGRGRRTPSPSTHNARSSSVRGRSSQPAVGGRRGWPSTRREEAAAPVAWACPASVGREKMGGEGAVEKIEQPLFCVINGICR
jgi:hypothetical protein